MEFLSESEKGALRVDMEDVINNDGEYPKGTPRKTLALLYEARVLRRAGEDMCALAGTTDWEGCEHPWTFEGWIAQAKAEIDKEAQ